MHIEHEGHLFFHFANSRSNDPDGYNERYVVIMRKTKPFKVSVFVINYIHADTADFGVFKDGFSPKPPQPEVLTNYKITEKEYQQVCEALDKISIKTTDEVYRP